MARILIAEHDPVAAEAAAVICKAARQAVTVVGTGVEALLLLDAVPYDLLIVGLWLPRMDGSALTRAIRDAEAPYATMPIVGVGPASAQAALEALREAGADAVVHRPFRHGLLGETVARLLARGPSQVTLFRRGSGDHELEKRDA